MIRTEKMQTAQNSDMHFCAHVGDDSSAVKQNLISAHIGYHEHAEHE